MVLYCDIETYSPVDIRSAGAYPYAQNCELLMVGYAIGDGDASVWDLTGGRDMPAPLHVALSDPSVRICAHNAFFEWWVLREKFPQYDWAAARFLDTAALAASVGLPRHLAGACDAVGVEDGLNKLASNGARLIQRFCKPAPATHKADRYTRETHPQEWDDFVEYCRRDVIAMRELASRLPEYNYQVDYPVIQLDMVINDRGLPIDLPNVENAIAIYAEVEKRITNRLKDLTGLPNPNSRNQFLEWLRANGVNVRDVTKNTLQALLEDI